MGTLTSTKPFHTTKQFQILCLITAVACFGSLAYALQVHTGYYAPDNYQRSTIGLFNLQTPGGIEEMAKNGTLAGYMRPDLAIQYGLLSSGTGGYGYIDWKTGEAIIVKFPDGAN